MRIAVEGCCHGKLDEIYSTIAAAEQDKSVKIDLLLICGDFQATRTLEDLACMSVPDKYKEMGSFYKYYSGEKVAPVLTIFIGGNHEASNYMQELFYGGWVAPSIYYLGSAGVINIAGLRIGGLSGIFKANHFGQPNYEQPPYSPSTMRSVYHVRELQTLQLKLLRESKGLAEGGKGVDIFLSHDWPRGIARYGDMKTLLRRKQFLRREIHENTLGSPPGEELLHLLQPTYWFAAHMHVKFSAVVKHDSNSNNSGFGAESTKFLALDKCLPGRDFLQVLEVDVGSGSTGEMKLELEYDPRWLAVLKATHHLEGSTRLVRPTEAALQDSLAAIRNAFGNDYTIKPPAANEFWRKDMDTSSGTRLPRRPEQCGNPQTDEFLQRLGVTHSGITVPCRVTSEKVEAGTSAAAGTAKVEADSNEIDLDDF